MREPCTRSSRAERGHTLIEVMVAMALFTVGVLGLLPLFYSSAQGLTVSSRITQGTAIAESRLADLMTRAFTDTLLSAGTHPEGAKNIGSDGVATAGNFGAAAGSDGWFARTWTVTDVAVNGNAFKNIVVQVEWYDAPAHRTRKVAVVGGRGAVR